MAHFAKHLGGAIDRDGIQDVVRISCIKFRVGDEPCLSVGAPSSPLLSNTVMYCFDTEVAAWCMQNNIVYTRYADDLTFSTSIKNKTSQVEPAIREIVRGLDYPRLRFNNKKTIHVSKKQQRRVTGVVINNEGHLSLGRDRKREISSLIHKYSLHILPDTEIFRLQGLLGFSKNVEPLFLARMRTKYGSSMIDDILKVRKNPS